MAAHVKLGVAVAMVPVGAINVAAVGGKYVTVSVAFAVLFAASCAVMVITVVPPPSVMPVIDHAVVPVATPVAPRLVVHVTSVTPTLSLAVPLTASVSLVVAYVPVLVGAVSASVGTVASRGVVIDAVVVALVVDST
jgi:hypothetical protein